MFAWLAPRSTPPVRDDGFTWTCQVALESIQSLQHEVPVHDSPSLQQLSPPGMHLSRAQRGEIETPSEFVAALLSCSMKTQLSPAHVHLSLQSLSETDGIATCSQSTVAPFTVVVGHVQSDEEEHHVLAFSHSSATLPRLISPGSNVAQAVFPASVG